jgi:EAL domain-containing protein (putative c-di-GMP-specific phosphodiesterase class I)
VIKIDKTFVDRMQPQNASFAIVKGVIGIASDLGILVVAEGVETPLQAAQLRDVRCPLAQGFHFVRPTDHRQIARLLVQTQRALPDRASLRRGSMSPARSRTTSAAKTSQ